MLPSLLLGIMFGVAQAPLVTPLPRVPRNDSTIGRWRAIAKDGYELPKAQATERPANVQMGAGETADFELRLTKPGQWRLEIKTTAPGWYIPLPIVVVPAGSPR